MKGSIRTKEVCPQCRGKFKEESKGLFCPKCRTTPSRFFIDWYLGQGQRLRKFTDDRGYPFSSYDHAFRYLNKMRDQVDNGKFDPREYVRVEIKKLQFSNYARAWLSGRRNKVGIDRLSRDYLRSLEIYFEKYLIPFFEHISIREIHEGHIERFKETLPAKLKPKTVSNMLAGLRKMLRDACFKYKDILHVPDFPKVQVPEPETKWVWEDEQMRILEGIRNSIYKACIRFLMLQGCRPGEARALRWENVDFEKEIPTPDGQIIKGVITIRAAMDQEVYEERTKERDVRVLPMHPEVRQILSNLPRCLSGFVFAYRGKPIIKNCLTMAWVRATRKAGVNISLYQATRHSFASQAINSGTPKHLIGAFLGHKDPKSTERYAHLETGPLVQCWNRPEKVRHQIGTKAQNGVANLLEFKRKK
jgi:integrase